MSEELSIKEQIAQAVSEATEGLAAKNRELLAELKTARKGQEIKPEQLDALQSKIDSLENDLANATKQNKDLTKQFEKATADLQNESGFTQKLLLDNGLTDALVKNGVAPQFLPAVKAMLSTQAKVVVDGETRKAVIGDKDLNEFITGWASSDDGKHYISAPANNGGGANGSSGQGGKQTINRSAFDGLSNNERMDFVKSGGTITD